MADKKITELDAVTTLVDADLFTVVVNTGTTPLNKKITKANVLAAMTSGTTSGTSGTSGGAGAAGVAGRRGRCIRI
jgi:hypothetical protein